MAEANLAPRIETATDLHIVGMSEHYERAGDPRIGAQWSQFMSYADRVPGRIGHEAYGVVANMNPDGFDYIAGVEVPPDANVRGFNTIALPNRRYAVFTHHGNVSALPQTMQSIYRDWQPKSGETFAQAPFFERYDDRFDPKTGSGEVEIWMPLEN